MISEINALHKRFLERERSPERHRGHVVNTAYPEVPGETRSVEELGITADGLLKAFTERGTLGFEVGGERITVDTTDFAKVNYEDIAEEIKRRITVLNAQAYVLQRKDNQCQRKTHTPTKA
jgi:hypothetical protein